MNTGTNSLPGLDEFTVTTSGPLYNPPQALTWDDFCAKMFAKYGHNQWCNVDLAFSIIHCYPEDKCDVVVPNFVILWDKK